MDDLDTSDAELARLQGDASSDSLPFRLRSNTWPLQRFEDSKPHEADQDEDGDRQLHSSTDSKEGLVLPSRSSLSQLPVPTSTTPTPSGSVSISPGSLAKKNSSRKNAWGSMSYADMIAQAIHSSPEQRLTLSQIYEWMVHNVPYFKDKGDSNSSAGWKNSIRHNLSLHNRFVRVQNEGTGKSSWWMINPDAKPGKSTRRRAATMDSTQKFQEKRRGRIRKQPDDPRGLASHKMRSPSSPISESAECLMSQGLLNQSLSAQQSPMHLHAANLTDGFRSRTGSNASSFGRLSPFEGEAHTPSYSPHPWTNDYEHPGRMVGSCENKDLLELDALHSLRLQDSGIKMELGSNPGENRSVGLRLTNVPQLHPSGLAPWNTTTPSIAQEVNGVKINPAKLTTDPKLSPSITAASNAYTVHTNIFSGGTFSVSEEQNKANHTFPQPFSVRPVAVMARTQQHQQRPHLMRPPSSHIPGQMGVYDMNRDGPLPPDLEQFMETNQSAFEVDVDAVLKHELNIEGNLDFNSDQLGSFLGPGSSGEISSESGGLNGFAGPRMTLPRYNSSNVWSSTQ